MPKSVLHHYLWNAVRIAIAAALAWWDQRLFFAYWFLLTCNLYFHLEGIFQRQDLFFNGLTVRQLAILETLGVSPDDLEPLFARVRTRVASASEWEKIENEARVWTRSTTPRRSPVPGKRAP
jgi:hypothetical protein